MLEHEVAVFEAHRQEWLEDHQGEYVVIQGDRIRGFFDDYEEAFKAGLRSFGVQRSFLVKQIWEVDPVYFIGTAAAVLA